MAFMGVLLFQSVMAAFLFVFYLIMVFVGICLIVIGATGSSLNKLYAKLAPEEKIVSKHGYNKAAVIIGVMIILSPVIFGILGFFITAI